MTRCQNVNRILVENLKRKKNRKTLADKKKTIPKQMDVSLVPLVQKSPMEGFDGYGLKTAFQKGWEFPATYLSNY